MSIEAGVYRQTVGSYEEYIDSHVPDSFRTIKDSTIKALGDIRLEIKGKRVGDLGSGFGGLVKSLFLEGLLNEQTSMWSINPRLRDPISKKMEEKATQTRLIQVYPEATPAELRAAQDYHDAHLIKNFAHNLKDVRDNFFDLLIDNWAVHLSLGENSSLYKRTLTEIVRTLRPGGKLIVGDGGGTRSALWEDANSHRRKVAAELGLRAEPIWGQNDWGDEKIFGVVLQKPTK